MGLYKIYFKDGEIFEGGDILNTRWSEISDGKEIASLEYFLPNGNKLTLEGYKQYVNVVECFTNLIGGKSGREITNVYIIGTRDYKIADSYRITLKAGSDGERFKTGDITFRSAPIDEIYQGGKVWGWKGIKPEI